MQRNTEGFVCGLRSRRAGAAMRAVNRSDAIAALTAQGQPYALADAQIQGRAVRVFVNAPPSLRTLFEENLNTVIKIDPVVDANAHTQRDNGQG